METTTVKKSRGPAPRLGDSEPKANSEGVEPKASGAAGNSEPKASGAAGNSELPANSRGVELPASGAAGNSEPSNGHRSANESAATLEQNAIEPTASGAAGNSEVKPAAAPPKLITTAPIINSPSPPETTAQTSPVIDHAPITAVKKMIFSIESRNLGSTPTPPKALSRTEEPRAPTKTLEKKRTSAVTISDDAVNSRGVEQKASIVRDNSEPANGQRKATTTQTPTKAPTANSKGVDKAKEKEPKHKEHTEGPGFTDGSCRYDFSRLNCHGSKLNKLLLPNVWKENPYYFLRVKDQNEANIIADYISQIHKMYLEDECIYSTVVGLVSRMDNPNWLYLKITLPVEPVMNAPLNAPSQFIGKVFGLVNTVESIIPTIYTVTEEGRPRRKMNIVLTGVVENPASATFEEVYFSEKARAESGVVRPNLFKPMIDSLVDRYQTELVLFPTGELTISGWKMQVENSKKGITCKMLRPDTVIYPHIINIKKAYEAYNKAYREGKIPVMLVPETDQ